MPVVQRGFNNSVTEFQQIYCIINNIVHLIKRKFLLNKTTIIEMKT